METTSTARKIIYSVRGTAVNSEELGLEKREPTVGKWYCGVNLDEANDLKSHGELACYEGQGCWSSEIPHGEVEPEMNAYDYLQEQL